MTNMMVQSRVLDPVLGSKRCRNCNTRMKTVPGYGDPLMGTNLKWFCPNCDEVKNLND